MEKQKSLRLLSHLVGELRWRYALYFLSTVAFALVLLLPPRLFQFFTENIQTLSDATARQFIVELLWFGGLVAVASFLSTFGSTLCQEWFRLQVEARLRRRILRALHQMPLVSLDNVHRGDWLTRMSSDLKQVEAFITESLPAQLRNIAILVGVALLFVSQSGVIAWLPLSTALLISVVNFAIQKKLAPVLSDLRTLHGGVFQTFIESLEGIRTVRTHSVERFIHGRFENKLSKIQEKGLRVVRFLGVLLGSNEWVGQLMVSACLVAASWSLAQSHLTVTEVMVYPFYIWLFYGAAQQLAGSAFAWNRFFIEGGRLAQLVYKKDAFPSLWETVFSQTDDVVLNQTEVMSLERIEVGYSNKPLTPPLSLEIAKGQLWAITGPSGCGKSTLLEVIAGLRPALGGQAKLLPAEGKPMWGSSEQDGMKLPLGLCAYVEQRPYIFHGTLRENLTFGSKATSNDESVWEMLERVNLAEFALRVGGLDHLLSDRGQNLSEGQKYRLALARALLLKRPFLLLDEPFATLDQASIETICVALTREKKNAGIVVVSHYLPTELTFSGTLDMETLQNTGFSKIRNGNTQRANVVWSASTLPSDKHKQQGEQNDQGNQDPRFQYGSF